MRHESFEKGIIQGMVEAKRKRGRPPREWMDDIKGWTGLSVAAAIGESIYDQKPPNPKRIDTKGFLTDSGKIRHVK